VRVPLPVPAPVRSLVLLATLIVPGCESRGGPPAAAPTVVTPPPNSAPEVTGDFLCVGPAGRRHVYPLRVVDPDGDRVSWRAEAVEARGELYPRGDVGLATPADLEIVYEPPADRAEENVIVLTVTDARGAATVVHLVARSG
jgi:hypothetical protein